MGLGLKVSERQIAEGLILLSVEYDATTILPGQFFQLRPVDRMDIFLARPISVFSYNGRKLSFLIRLKGRGTYAISTADCLFLDGPFGNGFKLYPSRKALLVAGGMGLAPLYFLADQLKKTTIDFDFIWGVRDGTYVDAIKRLGLVIEARIVSEDGSTGEAGIVSDFIDEYDFDICYVCGPIPMMETVLGRLKEKKGSGVIAQFSLEANMGCGWGGCKGCYVEFDGRGIYVCREGPVVEVLC